jgi:hypothetical protein
MERSEEREDDPFAASGLAGIALISCVALGAAGQSPAPSSGSGASPIPLTPETELRKGMTYSMESPFGPGSPRLILTVPGEGWSTVGVWNVGKDVIDASTVPEFHDLALTPWRVDQVVKDPCHPITGGTVDLPTAPSVDDLAAALVAQAQGEASAPAVVTVGGYEGLRLELGNPADVDLSTCDDTGYGRWIESGTVGGFTYGLGQRDVVYILDVDGVPGLLDTSYLPGVSETDRAELEALVSSIRFEPPG